MKFNNFLKVTAASLFAISVLGLTACGEDTPEPTPTLGALAVEFAADNFEVEAGGKISLPFTVTGVEGATLKLEATSDKEECTVSVNADANYSGEVEFVAPAITEGVNAVVTLKVLDEVHNRQDTATTTVAVGASEALAVAIANGVTSVAVKGGDTAVIPVVITGIGAATIAEPTLTVSNGWSAKWAWTEQEEGLGNATLTAPATPGEQVSLTIKVTDNFNREAEVKADLGVIVISNMENAANCHIVAPGNTVAINAVKGNSAEKLTFDNAVLVWQDQLGMVKSVAASPAAGVVAVELNAGIEGNAVVAAKQGDVIVWSWHLWVTNYDPEAKPMVYTGESGTTYTWMDRNLGARNNIKYDAGALGLLYQWGRKDPFVGADGVESSKYVKKYDIDGNQVYEVSQEAPSYPDTDYTSTNLEIAIQNPTIFYWAKSSNWPCVDWLTDDANRQDDDLWGGKSGYKTIYDPCPEGWMVPPAGDAWGFRKLYKKTGGLTDDGAYDPAYSWYIDYDLSIGFRYKPVGSEDEFWFPFAGKKDCNSGDLSGVGGGSNYHTRSTQNTLALMEIFAWGNPTSETGLNRPYGSSVRCIKETK